MRATAPTRAEPAQGDALLLPPESEVEDHRGAGAEDLERGGDEPALEDRPLTVRIGVAEERAHPFVGESRTAGGEAASSAARVDFPAPARPTMRMSSGGRMSRAAL